MGLPTFIRLENSLTSAMNYYNSPQMKQYSFEGVHLLPNHPYGYNQRTYATDGIELEGWEHVYVYDQCNNQLKDSNGDPVDLIESFDVLSSFNDITGLPQIIWQLKDCPFDAGYQLIYLEIIQGVGGNIYSSPFYLTADNSEYTSRWDYKDKDSDIMLSTGLGLYFRQNKSAQEVSNYTAVSTGRMFTASSRLTPFERWNTGVVEINVIEEFKKLFTCRYVYSLPTNFDGLPVRTSLYEAVESPDLEADENFSEQEIPLVRNYSQTYDPNALPIEPPAPPVDPKSINIRLVESLSNTQVKFSFDLINYNVSPLNLIYQYSLDNVSWTSIADSAASPQIVNIPNSDTINYYYRIFDMSNSIYSNTVQIPFPSINFQSVGSLDSAFNPLGNDYYAFYNAVNFTPTQNPYVEGSTNGTTWIPLSSVAGTNSPINFSTGSSGLEYTFFRLRYTPLSLTSNIKTHTF